MIWPTPSAASCAQSRRITFGRGSARRRSTAGRGGTRVSSAQRSSTVSSATDVTVPMPRTPSSTPTRTSCPGATFSTARRCLARWSDKRTTPWSRTSLGSSRIRFTGAQCYTFCCMPQLRLKSALVTRGHTQALKDGTVSPRSCTFEFEEVPQIIQAFRRMVRGLEFDMTEMAITTYLCARAHGKRFTALPVFPMRAFHHGAILVNANAGLRSPKDLEGRKVGVNRGYTVTTGLWARAVLQHEHGVD